MNQLHLDIIDAFAGSIFDEEFQKHYTHTQSDHGNWARGGMGAGVADSILARVRENGGLSVNMVDGSEPTSGYMVAKGAQFGSIVSADDFYDPIKGPKALADYFKRHKKELGAGKNYLGVWHNKDDGQVYLDVSENIQDRERAISAGQKQDQISIWDVTNFAEIETGGTGSVEKTGSGRDTKEHRGDDRFGDRSLRPENLGEVGKAYKVIRFEPGLIPVLKHGEHDQSTHGNWALSENYPDLLTLGTFDEESEYDSALAVYSERYGLDEDGKIVEPTTFEHDAIDSYSQEGYKNINAFLRNPRGFEDSAPYEIKFLQQKVDGLDSLIDKAPVMFSDKTLFRVVDDFVLAQLAPGDILRDKGFLSTTRIDITRDTDVRDALGEIYDTPDTVAVILPSPTKSGKGIAVDLYRTSVNDTSSVSDREKEVLLPRSTDLLFLGYKRGIGSEDKVAVFQRVDK
jgi:hypothetical protein